MGRYRAIMTDTDREYIAGEADVDDTKRYQAVSRVRSRITEELAEDVRILEEHHSGLLEELREVVCQDAESIGIAESDSSAGEHPPDDVDTEPEPEPTPDGEAEEPVEQSDPRPEPEGEPANEEIDALINEGAADDALDGSGEKLEARREALRAVVRYLREHGTAQPKDFREDVYPDHTAYYTEGDDPPYSWWTNSMYDGMKALAERTDKIEAADSTGVWRWRGDDR